MRIFKTSFLSSTIYIILTFLSCADIFIINKEISPYLENVKVDTFHKSGNLSKYPGVIKLVARYIEDSAYILLMPVQCADLNDIQHSFYLSKKLFVCSGDLNIFSKIFNLNNTNKTNNKNHSWMFCDEIQHFDDYDPVCTSLLISNGKIEEVKISDDMILQILFGENNSPPLHPN